MPFYDDGQATFYAGDVTDVLRALPDESVNCVVTSPPYWGLRDYGTATWDGGDAECTHRQKDAASAARKSTLGPDRDGLGANNQAHVADIPYRDICGKCGARRIDQQLGLEATPEAFVERMVAVFREVRRVLRKDGTCWLNLGSSYANTGRSDRDESPGVGAKQEMKAPGREVVWKSGGGSNFSWMLPGGFKPKDMVPIPWMVAMALQSDGWWLRQDIIWAKPNPMPESVTDRCTKSHEYLFLLTKSANYHYDADAVREPSEKGAAGSRFDQGKTGARDGGDRTQEGYRDEAGRNKRSVWTIATQPYPEAHFATFPEALVEPCVLAGCPEGGIVLDPFLGSGTTALVAKRLGRRAIGIDLSAEYLALAVKRCRQLALVEVAK